MAMSDTKRNLLVDAINTAFDDIGKSLATRIPRSKDNTSAIAAEYYLANHLCKMAEARQARAVKEAIAAGIVPDHKKEPLPIGTEKVVYSNDHVLIWVKVTNPSSRIDPQKMADYLVTKGKVPQDVVDKARNFANTQNKPAHSFGSSLVTK